MVQNRPIRAGYLQDEQLRIGRHTLQLTAGSRHGTCHMGAMARGILDSCRTGLPGTIVVGIGYLSGDIDVLCAVQLCMEFHLVHLGF